MKKKLPSKIVTLLEKYDIATPDDGTEYTEDELNLLINRVEQLIQKKKRGRLDIPNQGNKRFLSNIMQVVLPGIAAAATLLAERGLGPLPVREENEKNIAKEFSFDVMMHMIVGSTLPSQLFQSIAKTTDTNEKNQKIIAVSLELLTFLIAVHAATKGNEDRMASLFDSFSDKISKNIDLLGNYLNEQIISENVPKGTSEQLSLKLQQAKIALQKGEINKFIVICKGALGLLDMTPEILEKNLKEIEFIVNTLTEAMSTKEDNATAIAQAM